MLVFQHTIILYIQATSSSISEILKIKENFPNMSLKKIEDIHKMINNSSKTKLRINMTIKRLSKQQIINPMGTNNIFKFISLLENHIANINRALKNIKSDILADFVCNNYRCLIITTNKIVYQLDLSTIKNYIKNIDIIKTKDITALYLLQSKFYLKIIGISYIKKGINSFINSNDVKKIIQSTHIFNNIHLASKSYVIKISLKSDMVVIWIDIWNVQSRAKAKYLINRCFNINYSITMVRIANLTPDIFQCKNC